MGPTTTMVKEAGQVTVTDSNMSVAGGSIHNLALTIEVNNQMPLLPPQPISRSLWSRILGEWMAIPQVSLEVPDNVPSMDSLVGPLVTLAASSQLANDESLSHPPESGTLINTDSEGHLSPQGASPISASREASLDELNSGIDVVPIDHLDIHAQLARNTTPTRMPHEIYVRYLYPRGHGYPCANPKLYGEAIELGDAIIPQGDGVKVLDNIYKIPEVFLGGNPVPVVPTVCDPEGFVEGDTVTGGIGSCHVTMSEDQMTIDEITAHCPEDEGAILAITSPAEHRRMKDTDPLFHYLCKNASLLFNFLANNHSLPHGTPIYIVTETIHSASWATATYCSPMDAARNNLVLKRVAGNETRSPFFMWTARGNAQTRTQGRQLREKQDQCLFLKAICMSASSAVWEARREAIKLHSESAESHPTRPNEERASGSQAPSLTRSDNQGGTSLGRTTQCLSLDNPLIDDCNGISVRAVPSRATYWSDYPPFQANRALLNLTGADFALTHDDYFEDITNKIGDEAHDTSVYYESVTAKIARAVGTESMVSVQNGVAFFDLLARQIGEDQSIPESLPVDPSEADDPSTSDKEQMLRDILDWMPLSNPWLIQRETLSERTAGTRTSLVRCKEFLELLEIKGRAVWGAGKAGVGKTVLTAIAIEYAQQLAETSPHGSLAVAFAYIPDTKISLQEILASLVRQNLERHPHLLPLVRPLLAKHQRHKSRPTEQELRDVLYLFSKSFELSCYFIDGLDAASDDLRASLIESLTSLGINLFITSRPLQCGHEMLPSAKHIEIVAEDADIGLVVAEKIGQRPSLRQLLEKNNIKDGIIQNIRDRCGGMFIHASLQVEMLGECLSVKDVHETMQSIPVSLDDMYALTLQRIEEQSEPRTALAMRVLLWLVFARAPLRLDDLRFALATCSETQTLNEDALILDKTLIDVCCGLLTQSKESKAIFLVHHTAVEPLKPAVLKRFPQPDSALLAVCITHLTLHGVNDFKENTWPEGKPMLDYAYAQWSHHARICEQSEKTAAMVLDFVRKCERWPDRFMGVTDFLGPIHVAARYNLPATFSRMYSPDAHDAFGEKTALGQQTLLSLACRQGCTAIAKMLLMDEPGTSIHHTDTFGYTALMWATMKGHEDIATALLDRPDIRINQTNHGGCTPLWLAATYGHEGIARQLLHAQAIQTSIPNEGLTPLLSAILNKHKRIVGAILQALVMQLAKGDTSCLQIELAAAALHPTIDQSPLVRLHNHFASRTNLTDFVHGSEDLISDLDI